MKYTSIEDCYQDSKDKIISNEKNYLIPFIKELEELLKNTPFDIKNKLLEVINDYKINLTDFYHLMLINLTIKYYLIVKELHSRNYPYDETKHMDKIQTQNKKALKNNIQGTAPLSAKSYLQYFKLEIETKCLHNFNFETLCKDERGKIRDRNILIDELIKIIVSDNYANEKKFHYDLRTSSKAKEHYENEQKLSDLKYKAFLQNEILVKTIPPKK